MSVHSHTADDDFRAGTRQQTAWGSVMATAFALGEAGAGLFFVALLVDLLPGMVLGLAMVLLGKGGSHLLHLGQPLRGWRALTRINRSWVSRGLLALVVFGACGSLQVLQAWYGPLPQPVAWLGAMLALGASLVIMVYQGFAMAHSAAIPLWSSGVMPVISLVYALLGGVLLTLALATSAAEPAIPPATAVLLRVAAHGLLLLCLVAVLAMLHAAWYGSAGGRDAVRLLLRTDYACWFLPLVVGAGILVPAGLLGFHPDRHGAVLAATVAALIGFYAFRVLVFKAGTYDSALSSPQPLLR